MKTTNGTPQIKDRNHIAEEMKKFLADTYALYVMTQNFHWNVSGAFFSSLHELFEKQYLELAEAVDVIAERIRALGFQAPGSFREFSELTSLKEEKQLPDAEGMIRRLIDGHLLLDNNARQLADEADESGDLATNDLLSDRMVAHEKAVWMLKSTLARHAPETVREQKARV